MVTMTVTMLLKLSPIQCSVLDVHIREPCLETAGRKMIKFWYVMIYGWQRAVRDTPKRSCDSTRYQNYWDLITTAGQVRTRANSTGSGFWTTFSKFTWELVFGHIYHHISHIYIYTYSRSELRERWGQAQPVWTSEAGRRLPCLKVMGQTAAVQSDKVQLS